MKKDIKKILITALSIVVMGFVSLQTVPVSAQSPIMTVSQALYRAGDTLSINIDLPNKVYAYSIDLVPVAQGPSTFIGGPTGISIKTGSTHIAKTFKIPTTIVPGEYVIKFKSLSDSRIFANKNITIASPVIQTQGSQTQTTPVVGPIGPTSNTPTSPTSVGTTVPVSQDQPQTVPASTVAPININQTLQTSPTGAPSNFTNFRATITPVAGKYSTYLITWSGAPVGITVEVPTGFSIPQTESFTNTPGEPVTDLRNTMIVKKSGLDLKGSSGSKEFMIIFAGDSYLPTVNYTTLGKSLLRLGSASANVNVSPYSGTFDNRLYNSTYNKNLNIVVPRGNPSVVSVNLNNPKAGESVIVTTQPSLSGDEINNVVLTIYRGPTDIHIPFTKINNTSMRLDIPADVKPGKYSIVVFSIYGGVSSGIVLDVKPGSGVTTFPPAPTNNQSPDGQSITSARTMVNSEGYVLVIDGVKPFAKGQSLYSSYDKLILKDVNNKLVNLKQGRSSICGGGTEKQTCFFLSAYDVKYTGQYYVSILTVRGYETNKVPVQISHQTADGFYFNTQQDQVFEAGKTYAIKVGGFRGTGGSNSVKLKTDSLVLGAGSPTQDSIMVTIPTSLREGVLYQLELVNQETSIPIAPADIQARLPLGNMSDITPTYQQRKVLNYPLRFTVLQEAQPTPTNSVTVAFTKKEARLIPYNDVTGKGIKIKISAGVIPPVNIFGTMMATVLIEDDQGNRTSQSIFGVYTDVTTDVTGTNRIINSGKSATINFEHRLPDTAFAIKGRTYKVSLRDITWHTYPERTPVKQQSGLSSFVTPSLRY